MEDINADVIKIASKKLRKLRLTYSTPIMDRADPAITVQAALKSALGCLYDDSCVEYILKHGIKYYMSELHDDYSAILARAEAAEKERDRYKVALE